MIVTLTPNPSLDRTLVIEKLVRGGLNRAMTEKIDPGGKGVNVSVALATNGYATTAILPSGGDDGTHLANLLMLAGIDLHLVPIEAGTRSNVTLVEGGGVSTKVNAPGPVLKAKEQAALREATVRLSANADWVVACGSLPGAVDSDFYAQLVVGVRCKIAVDTTGDALLAAVDAGVDLIKPNLFELAEATGTSPRTLGEVVDVAQGLRQRGAKTVLVSLGIHGAVLVGDEVIYGVGAVSEVVSSVGAGDALLGGYLAEPAGHRKALARGLAWASASCETPNTEMPPPSRIAQQSVTVGDGFDPDLVVA